MTALVYILMAGIFILLGKFNSPWWPYIVVLFAAALAINWLKQHNAGAQQGRLEDQASLPGKRPATKPPPRSKRKPSPIFTGKGPYLAQGVAVDVHIGYRDLGGEETERLITVQQLMGKLHRDKTLTLDMVLAYCHLRQDSRTFSFSGIRHAADPDTGEILGDFPAWIAARCGRLEPVRGIEKS